MSTDVFGEYEVIGKHEYRGHKPGTVFVARLDRRAEQRAIGRRDIQLLRPITPSLVPGSYQLPTGWLEGTGTKETPTGKEQ